MQGPEFGESRPISVQYCWGNFEFLKVGLGLWCLVFQWVLASNWNFQLLLLALLHLMMADSALFPFLDLFMTHLNSFVDPYSVVRGPWGPWRHTPCHMLIIFSIGVSRSMVFDVWPGVGKLPNLHEYPHFFFESILTGTSQYPHWNFSKLSSVLILTPMVLICLSL